MRLFDDDSIEIPPIHLKSLTDDAEGRDLWKRLEALEARRKEAEATLHRESQPLADLLAEADELAALVLVGDAEEEEAQAAEDNVQAARQRVEDARRAVNQCDRAEFLVRKKLRARAQALHEENTDAVRSVHRVLLHHALNAERRAAGLLRLLREFEQQYARYSTDDASARHPQYLTEEDRTVPPRPLLGPARASGGTVFDRSEAAAWMRRAAERVEADAPPLLEIDSLDFESPEAAPEYIALSDVAADDPPVSRPQRPTHADDTGASEETGALEEEASPDEPDASPDAVPESEDAAPDHGDAETAEPDAESETPDAETGDAESDAASTASDDAPDEPADGGAGSHPA